MRFNNKGRTAEVIIACLTGVIVGLIVGFMVGTDFIISNLVDIMERYGFEELTKQTISELIGKI